MTEVRAGMLLVATPVLLDPNFVETVVLLLDVDDSGALGVVLNRPSVIPVADVLEGWDDVLAEPEVLFHGGPVSTDGALALARLSRPEDVPVGFRELAAVSEGEGDGAVDGEVDGEVDRGTGDGNGPGAGGIGHELGLVDLDTPVELLDGSLAGLRVFAGYAGWGAEQLQAEIEEGSWYVVPAELADVFREDPGELWREVLRRQPGELAWHSTRPLDPGLN